MNTAEASGVDMGGDVSQTYDVAIAGAGLAGSSLALRLARGGARVALLDPGSFPREKLCGEYLSPEAWGVLGRLGLAGDVGRSGYHAIRTVRITTPRGRVVEADVSGPDGLPGIGLSRSALDDLLIRRAREAGVSVFERSSVASARVEDGRVVGLDARHPSQGTFSIRSRVAVAANGRHSALVAQTGRTRGRSRFRPRLFGLKRHFRVDAADATEPEGSVGLHLVPGGYGGTCRVEGGQVNLCALLPDSEVRRRRGDLDRVASESLGRNPVLARLGEACAPCGAWKAVSGVRVEVSAPAIPGILYAGDCQGTVDPLGGQGMTMALLGAEALAPFVEEGLASAEGVGPAIQRACQEAWRARFDRRVNLCRLFHHALTRPALIDAASLLRGPGRDALAVCFRLTRDPEFAA